ncbi:Putative endoglucanase [Aquisphaera giovannonii]|uniref:Endoglucanase n=1 Tax=Aquisphaera giovannonii TaxID=406548 RepID=A0A5B9VV80_9BACT|nr:glycoside hydrolase family 140 protein [Aquisphaera giovannonii]QEH32049.1 Putative endoglucanase [Aquisphaera giovannonii]
MRSPGALLVLAASALSLAPAPARAAAPPTWEELRRLPKDCPVVYDNDWLGDTNDDEYLLAKAHLGQARLRGFILSKDQWDNGRQYKVADGRADFERDLAIARRSGLRAVPEVTLGADRLLERPASGRVEDAKPVASAGTDLIVREAREASPQRPLVVIVGGPLCTVASAVLSDPSIADRMLVMMTDIDGYNGSDPWANYVVATRCKLVNFGASPLGWPQRPGPPIMPPARFDALPDREITRSMKKVALGFWERSTRKEKPDRDDGFADGAGTFLLYRPETWTGVKKVRVSGAWSHEDAPSGPYHYLDATGIEPGLMTEEFFATMAAALRPDGRGAGREVPCPAKVSDNHRYLIDQRGEPFFYLGDTAWELFHRLSRDEANTYLEDRAAKRFNVIQAVVLAEHGGLDVPNANGDLPLEGKDPTRPVEAYFRHVDAVVARAEELGLVIGMLPTWGSWWHDGPGIFTPESARSYGEFLGRRYKDRPIVWILGGDRPVEDDRQREILRAMAAGLRQGDGGRHLMTFHPPGGRSSAEWFHGDEWLAFNMIQSGHGYDHDNYERIAAQYAREPAKPCVDGEPGYEDHPAEFNPKNGYLDDYEARKFAYWSVFAGACGHTYGCHDIWQFYDEGRRPITAARTPWKAAKDLPGAGQMQHLRALVESRPVLARVPDQSLLASDAGRGTNHVQATRAEDGSYAFVYSASGEPFTVDLGKLSGGRLRACWFDPRDGTSRSIGSLDRKGRKEFHPPSVGKGHDWVLVLDDEERGRPEPGRSAR